MTDILNRNTIALYLQVEQELHDWGINPHTARFDPAGTLIRETTMVREPTMIPGDGMVTGDRDRMAKNMLGGEQAMDAKSPPIQEATQQELRRCALPYSGFLHNDFLDSVLWVEDTLGLKGKNLIACMAFETGESFSPHERNPGSTATGLIQFMDATAKRLGTTTQALSVMTQVEQMNYVFKYFKSFGSDLSHWDICDTYMAILYPVGIGKPGNFPVFVNGKGPTYAPNRGLDANKDGTVTKDECCIRIVEMLDRGNKQQRKF